MKFLADINIPASTVSLLKTLAHDVLDLKQKDLSAKDVEIIKLAQKENRIIITPDKDFLELGKFAKYKVPLIVIRIKKQKFENITSHVHDLLKNQTEEILATFITVVREEMAESYPLDR